MWCDRLDLVWIPPSLARNRPQEAAGSTTVDSVKPGVDDVHRQWCRNDAESRGLLRPLVDPQTLGWPRQRNHRLDVLSKYGSLTKLLTLYFFLHPPKPNENCVEVQPCLQLVFLASVWLIHYNSTTWKNQQWNLILLHSSPIIVGLYPHYHPLFTVHHRLTSPWFNHQFIIQIHTVDYSQS